MLAGQWPMQKVVQKLTAFKKRTVVDMMHAVQPTGQQQAVHHSITHPRRAGGLCPFNNWGHCASVANIHSIPRGKEKTKRNPTTRGEVLRLSPRRAGSLRQRGDTRIYLKGCSRLHSVKGDSARGTEHYECQGH